MRGLVLAVLVAGLAGPAMARTYEGREAAALRCANTLALTAVALNAAGRMGDAEKDGIIGVTIRILDRHVSGTWRERKAAMEVMRDRRGLSDTLDDFRRNAARCLVQFPIN